MRGTSPSKPHHLPSLKMVTRAFTLTPNSLPNTAASALDCAITTHKKAGSVSGAASRPITVPSFRPA